MPDVLARDVQASDKEFIESYARRHGLSQAEVIRQVVHAGVDRLRAHEQSEDADWEDLAESLERLSDEDFERSAWG